MEKQFIAEKERSRTVDKAVWQPWAWSPCSGHMVILIIGFLTQTTEQLKLKHLLQEKDDTIKQLQEKIKSLRNDKKLLEDDKDRARKERAEARLPQVSVR